MADKSGFHEMVDLEQKKRTFSEREKRAVLETIRQRLSEHPEVRFAFLHGSFLGHLPVRDVDIAVYLDPSLTPEAILETALALSVELTSAVRLRVDVQPLNSANPAFAYYATQGELIASRDHEETYEFVENTWLAYMDFSSLIRQLAVDFAD